MIRNRFLSGVTGVALTIGAGVAQEASAQSIAVAYCKTTMSFGMAKGASEGRAAEIALRHCSGGAGSTQLGCCKFVKATDIGCIAIAVGPTGEYGVDTGSTQMEAISAAVEECPEKGCVAKMARCLD